jgi:hypothetical protein
MEEQKGTTYEKNEKCKKKQKIVRKHQRKRPHRSPRYGWEDNIKVDLK